MPKPRSCAVPWVTRAALGELLKAQNSLWLGFVWVCQGGKGATANLGNWRTKHQMLTGISKSSVKVSPGGRGKSHLPGPPGSVPSRQSCATATSRAWCWCEVFRLEQRAPEASLDTPCSQLCCTTARRNTKVCSERLN